MVKKLKKNLTRDNFFNIVAVWKAQMLGAILFYGDGALVRAHAVPKAAPNLKEEPRMRKEKKEEKAKRESKKTDYVKPILTKHKKLKDITAGLTMHEM